MSACVCKGECRLVYTSDYICAKIRKKKKREKTAGNYQKKDNSKTMMKH